MRNTLIKVTAAVLILSISISACVLFGPISLMEQKKQVRKMIINPIDVRKPLEETKGIEIERLLSGNDKDADGIDDLEDIIQGKGIMRECRI
ncbi:MAG: hypothetical protein ACYCYE_02365 [Clostridia bacterium]